MLIAYRYHQEKYFVFTFFAFLLYAIKIEPFSPKLLKRRLILI